MSFKKDIVEQVDSSDFNSEISSIRLANLQYEAFSVGLNFAWIS